MQVELYWATHLYQDEFEKTFDFDTMINDALNETEVMFISDEEEKEIEELL